MIYIDTSSLLKLFIVDRQSDAVDAAIKTETAVVISLLTQLEASVQLKAYHLGGGMSHPRYLRMRQGFAQTIAKSPFVSRLLASNVFSAAIDQHEKSTIHCRSLDRLHLAAMEEFGITRLMTHDARQAEAARDLGFEVVSPGS